MNALREHYRDSGLSRGIFDRAMDVTFLTMCLPLAWTTKRTPQVWKRMLALAAYAVWFLPAGALLVAPMTLCMVLAIVEDVIRGED